MLFKTFCLVFGLFASGYTLQNSKMLCSNEPQVAECSELAVPVLGIYDDFNHDVFVNSCQACHNKGVYSYTELTACSPKFLRVEMDCESFDGKICALDESNQLYDFENVCYGCSNPNMRWYVEGDCPKKKEMD